MVGSLFKLAFVKAAPRKPEPCSCLSLRFNSENLSLNHEADVEHTACFESGKKPAFKASKQSVLLLAEIAFSSSTSSKAVGLRSVDTAGSATDSHDWSLSAQHSSLRTSW